MNIIIQNNKTSFKKLHKEVNNIFDGFNTSESRHYHFQDTHMLCICPGSRNGGNNEDVIEIFWGRSKPYKIQREYTNDFSIKEVPLFEIGATLLYSMDERGRVVVLLYPPETNDIKPIAQAYMIDSFINTEKCLNKKTLKKHWKYFNAVMECCSLFGKAKPIDEFIFFIIRTFRVRLINNVIEEHSVFGNWLRKHVWGIIISVIASVIAAIVIKYLIE